MSPEIDVVIMVVFGALVLAGFRFGVEAASHDRGRSIRGESWPRRIDTVDIGNGRSTGSRSEPSQPETREPPRAW